MQAKDPGTGVPPAPIEPPRQSMEPRRPVWRRLVAKLWQEVLTKIGAEVLIQLAVAIWIYAISRL